MRTWLIFAAAILCVDSYSVAQLPDGIKFDDGFTWIECKNFDTVVKNLPVGHWVPECSFRILGKVPDRSGWKVVVKQGGKSLGEYVNDGFPVRLAGGESIGMNVVGFWRQKPQLDADGLLDLEVYYIDGKTDKEYLARTCKLDVRKAARERGSVRQRDPGASSFYVNRHAEILSTILYFRPPEYPSYTQGAGLGYFSDSTIEFLLNYSENENFSGPALGRVRIEVDGKQIETLVLNNVPQDEVGLGQIAGKYNVEHSDRAAEKYFKSGPAYRERIGFCRRSMVLPVQWGAKPNGGREPSKLFTNDHPGQWKVTYLIDRKPVRIYRFTIGPDGLPLPHPEQEKGLTLAPGAVLVDTEIPGEGGEFDGRLTSEFVKAGAFFGRAWMTDSFKKLAEQVPAKGTPFPVPSDQQK